MYPCVTSLHAYQPTPFTTNCSQERNRTSLQGATRHPWPAIGLEPTLYPTWLIKVKYDVCSSCSCFHPRTHGSLYLAEREGFEPPLQFPVIQFSRLTQSTTLPSLRIWVTNGNRTHDTRYHKPLLYLLSYSHHLKLIVIDFIRNLGITLHTPLESWELRQMSTYP